MFRLTTYNIIEATEDSKVGYQPFGAAVDLWLCKKHQVIISGPAETGKTLAALQKLDALMWKYKGAQAVIIRKTYKSTVSSCIQTWENKVLGKNTPVKTYGGSRPEFYDYPNGSRVWVGGMDNPDKVLSSERDFIYVNQAEELELDEWETLTTRATGRAGNSPYAQVFGDCNPGGRTHWILEREREGKLTLFHSRHQDNPTLYNRDGTLTPQGGTTMSVLDNLTGVRYQRLRLGKWVSAEGQIYTDFDPSVHLIDSVNIPGDWRRIRCIDFGLRNPFVCGWWAIDPDGRMYLYRQLYMTGRTVATHARQINQLSADDGFIEMTICDHDAEDRQTLTENGIPNIAARKDVLQGIGRVQDRLKLQADGRPRLFIVRDCLVEVDQYLKMERKPYKVEDEFDGYIWMNNVKKDQPTKEDDHGMDMVRYMTMHLDGRYRSAEVSSYLKTNRQRRGRR